MRRDRLTRRSALTLLAGSSLTLARAGWGQAGAGIGCTGIDATIDAGIGGTGIDAGIGGTGIFGLIEGFSSIWVNDMRVEIPETAVITLNGRPAQESDLALGQTVAVEAVTDADGTLQATRIDATFALVGPVEAVETGRSRTLLRVLGQQVELSELTDASGLLPDAWVVVTGLRDHRGTIQAAHVQPTDGRDAVVTGPVTSDGRVAGVRVALTGDQVLQTGTRATVQGPLLIATDGASVIQVRDIITRPLSVFDPARVNDLVLAGLPGGEDGVLIIDGHALSVPGIIGQAEPGERGLRARLHGRFERRGGLFQISGRVLPSNSPRGPFRGPGRIGLGKDRPHKHPPKGKHGHRKPPPPLLPLLRK